MSLNERIIAAISGPLGNKGYELVVMRIVSGVVISVDIDIDRLDNAPVSVDDCVAASRIISAIFDVEDFIKGKYNINVSSPGEYRPINNICDFSRFLDREVVLELRSPRHNRRKITGKLLRVEQNSSGAVVYLKEWCDTVDEEIAVPYQDVKKATVKRVFRMGLIKDI
ncbi:ribosome maturation factor RimP [Alphaproteobacteria bacterium]|nr:ribosome maturation factor RimP [Alphaproteobacteria bacterium]